MSEELNIEVEETECTSCHRKVPVNCDRICSDCYEFHEERRNDYGVHSRTGYKKKEIPNHIRWDVLERDNFTCQKCGSRRFLEVDHVKAEKVGGKTDVDNLQVLCRSCNRSKGAK